MSSIAFIFHDYLSLPLADHNEADSFWHAKMEEQLVSLRGSLQQETCLLVSNGDLVAGARFLELAL